MPTVEDLTVDGVSLKSLAWRIDTLGATLRTPARKVPSGNGSGRNGVPYIAGKLYDKNTLDISMWIDSTSADGSAMSRAQFFANLNALTRLFGKTYALLDVRHTQPDGSVRQVLGEVIGTIDFTTDGNPPFATFGVSLDIPAAFWQDVNTTTYQTIMGSGLPQTLAVFPNATAPLEDLVFTVRGPITNPTLTDPTSGNFIKITTTLAAGDLLVVDNVAMNVTKNGVSYLAPSGQIPLSYTNVGSSTFLGLMPANVAGGALVTLSGSAGSTSGTNGTQLTVVGRAKYLLG